MALAGLGVVGLGAVAGIAGVSADLASHFQSDMAMVQTQAGASAQEVKNVSQAVIALAPTVGMGPDALAAGIYHLESAGFRGATAINALKIAAEGAQVGHADLESVTNALDAVLVAGGDDAKNMSNSMGELNAVVGAGDMRMQDLADAMGTGILANAHVFGLSLQDVGGALATFGDNNIRGSKAAVYLRQVISMMGAPSHAAAKALKSVGISSTELGNDMRKGGLVKALTDLQAHLKKSGLTATEQAQVISEAFGGGKTSSGINILLTQLGRLKSKTEEVGKTGGAFGSAWAATQQTAAQQMNEVKASLEAAATALGTALLPMISKALKMVMPYVTGLAQWISHNQGLSATILLVAAGLFAVLIPLGLLIAAIAAIGGPILFAVGLVAAIVLALTHWHQTVQLLQQVIANLGPIVSQVWATILATLQKIVPQIVQSLQDMGAQALATLEKIVPKVVAQGIAIGSKLVKAIVDRISQLPYDAGLWLGRVAIFLAGLPTKMIPIATKIGQAIIDGIIRFGPTILSDAVNFFGQLGSFLLSLPTHFATMALRIAAAFVKGFLDGLGSLPKQVGKLLHSVPLLGNLMDIGGSGLKTIMDHLPAFAAGGIVRSPTIALIGEDGPEAVVPLSGGQGIATTLAGFDSGLGLFGGDQTIHIPIYLDGRQIADVLDKRLGRARALRGSSAMA